jgi:hypothetical protein
VALKILPQRNLGQYDIVSHISFVYLNLADQRAR